jgi:sialidase-1
MGKYRGRIFIAANHSAGNPQKQSADYSAFGFYTDDHGKTFHISEAIRLPGSNESTAAELSNNKLMMNSRNQKGDIKARIISISSNGGASWDTTYFDTTLIDPVNEGSLLTICHKRKENVLAFCNAADTVNRNNLTLRISYNDGKAWTKKFVVDKNNNKKDYTAYSDLTKISKNRLGILYERNNYSEIVFTTLKWKE